MFLWCFHGETIARRMMLKYLGVYRKRETAERALRTFAEEFATDHKRTIEEGPDFFNVHDNGGNDYQVFEVKEQVVIED